MNYIVRYLIKLLISSLDLFIPTDKKLLVFYISPNTCWDANMQCVYALTSKKRNSRNVVCYLRPKNPPHLSNSPCISFLSPTGLWACLRAGVIFTDHALPPGITNTHRQCVNLWHGIPIKQIRYFCKKKFPPGYLRIQTRYTSTIISSSLVDKLAMTASFQISPEKVAVTGLPRNDLLLNRRPFLEQLPYLADEQKKIIHSKGNKRLILYAPTYPETSQQNDTTPPITEEEEAILAGVLTKNNAILGIRDHLFSQTTAFPSLFKHGLAVMFPAQKFSNTNLLLSHTDMLITDYSSIWVDFLLLRRPIIGFCPNLEHYLAGRGFLYDFTNTFPGCITRSTSELLREINRSLTQPGKQITSKQKMMYRLFHEYNDGRNTERVVDLVLNAE